jgi:predicted nucleic acid-binding protein
MIVVDTSVWIDYFNGHSTLETATLDLALGEEAVAIGDLILVEILQGFRSAQDYKIAKKHLATLQQFNMLGLEIAIKAADNYRKIRKKGLTVRKTADVIIATFCIENRLPLLFTDKDFLPFVEYLRLRTVTAKAVG